MEQDDMASENQRDTRVAPERDPIKGSRLRTRPAPPSSSSILNDGPELLRSIHC
jgi:hypothetical protein